MAEVEFGPIHILVASTDTAPTPPLYSQEVRQRQRAHQFKKTLLHLVDRLEAQSTADPVPEHLRGTLAELGFLDFDDRQQHHPPWYGAAPLL